MNWTKWSSIAEIISSLAIVITLIYLTIGTKQNTDALHANSRQASLDAELTFFTNVMAYPELGRRGGIPGATDIDVRYNAHLLSFLRIREFLWFQYQSGILDENTWQSYVGPTILVFNSPESRILLNNYQGDPAFKSYLNALLEE